MKRHLEHLTDWLIIILLCVLLGIAFGYGIGKDLEQTPTTLTANK